MVCRKIKSSFEKLEIEIYRKTKVTHLRNAFMSVYYKNHLANGHNCFGRWLLCHTLFPKTKLSDPVIPDKRSFNELELLIRSSANNNKTIRSKILADKIIKIAEILTKQTNEYIKRFNLKLSIFQNGNIYIIKIDNHEYEITNYIYNKLVSRFTHKCIHNNELYMNIKILQLIIRYSNLESPNGRNFQGALPDKIFEMLKTDTNCMFETFAAPQYSYYDKCCSAYYDTDKYFGSVGTFMKFKPNEGTYECAPPNSEYFLNTIIKHLLKIFDNANGNICFILFMPDWGDLSGLNQIEKSQYMTNKYIFDKNTQVYESKNFNGKSILSIIPNSSRLYILQKNSKYDGKNIYENIKNIYKTYTSRYTYEYHYDTDNYSWINYDLLQDVLMTNDKFIMSSTNAIIKPLPETNDILNYIQNIDNITIKATLYSNINFSDLIPPDTYIVEEWKVIGSPKDSEKNKTYFVKPSWIEIGGGFGIQIFGNFNDAVNFINQQKKQVTDNLILGELNSKLLLNGYSKYSVPSTMRKLTLDKNRDYKKIYPEFYYFSAIQKEIIPDLYNGSKYDIRVFLLMWYCNGEIKNIYVLNRALMRISIEKYIDNTIDHDIMITTNDLHSDKKSETHDIDITQEIYASLRQIINKLSDKIKKYIKPDKISKGYGYLGVDFIKGINQQWYLLEINEHPYFREVFRKDFFDGVIDLALIPAITCEPYQNTDKFSFSKV